MHRNAHTKAQEDKPRRRLQERLRAHRLTAREILTFTETSNCASFESELVRLDLRLG